MDEHNNSHMDPWDRDSYETGSTKPPKDRSGLVAILLVLVIFLVGLSSTLGILNTRLSYQQTETPRDGGPVVFYPTDHLDTPIPSVDSTAPAATTPISPNAPSLDLKPTPDSVDNVVQPGGLSLQEIYARNIDSVVSISCTLSGTSAKPLPLWVVTMYTVLPDKSVDSRNMRSGVQMV